MTLRATAVRYVRGGWGKLVDRLSKRAEELGVLIQVGSRLERLPESPVIVAMSLEAASILLGSELRWPGSRTAILDLGLDSGGRWPTSVLDLDGHVYAVRVSSVDPSVAPAGHELIQVSAGMPPGASIDDAVAAPGMLSEVGHQSALEATARLLAS